jgi:hypothetical protein
MTRYGVNGWGRVFHPGLPQILHATPSFRSESGGEDREICLPPKIL